MAQITSLQSSDQSFREVLVDVGKELTKEDVELIAFESGIFARAERDTIKDGVQLMVAMHNKNFIRQDSIVDLLEILSRRNLNQACFHLRKYEEEIKCKS